MKSSNVNFKAALQQDNVFVNSELKSLSEISGMPTRKGLEKVVISEGSIVNVVSNSYGHLPNEQFFVEVERKLIDADINYDIRSINRENRSFAVDYILNDESLHINIKNGMDKIKPMLRFTNSYDGSAKTSGHFGFFREVCSNGLHVAHSEIGFSVKHRGDIAEIVLPEISGLVRTFMNNEFYELQRKFEVLAETQVTNIQDFVKSVCAKTALFQFEASEKNPEPSLNARLVMDIINRESSVLNSRPNLWLGYNAFNEVLHNKLKKGFEAQKQTDSKIFSHILEMAN